MILDKLKLMLEEDSSDEMTKWFHNRTNKHISLVKNYAKIIEKFMPEFDSLSDQVKDHDKSKFEEPELTPYIHITWKYKKEADDEKYNIPKEIDEKSATLHHVKNNEHHPEYYDENSTINSKDRDSNPKNTVDASDMPDNEIAEMIADWMAVSEERGGDIDEWMEKVIDKRFKFTDHQKELISKIVDIIKTKNESFVFSSFWENPWDQQTQQYNQYGSRGDV